DILALDIAELAQPLPQVVLARRVQGAGGGNEHTYLPDFCRLLRLDWKTNGQEQNAQSTDAQSYILGFGFPIEAARNNKLNTTCHIHMYTPFVLFQSKTQAMATSGRIRGV